MSSKKNKKRQDTNLRSQPSSANREVTKIKIPEGISFSFRYYQDDKDKFSISKRDAKYLTSLLKRLRDLSQLKVDEVINNQSKSLRCHRIDWQDTTEPDGFGLLNEDQLVSTPYQFQISANEYGRVHGFFSENVFYIIWLDPDHNLYI
ncbi:hypothetical protein NIES2119_26945 [[Phormidium ambiguum] IAM M-71]|uniref:Uncharacterized protein n=1 Tax=[Phormidium ambiguum] IAM M-71 TaxID=454136 RepID=A0A1U7I762_9CYAN|nr:hypothetical protein [Phormidium ambiguum]OKH32147.1 hypothetical protein NIES2119_26945 [Phormidium ambiguum IAM M-71]